MVSLGVQDHPERHFDTWAAGLKLWQPSNYCAQLHLNHSKFVGYIKGPASTTRSLERWGVISGMTVWTRTQRHLTGPTPPPLPPPRPPPLTSLHDVEQPQESTLHHHLLTWCSGSSGAAGGLQVTKVSHGFSLLRLGAINTNPGIHSNYTFFKPHLGGKKMSEIRQIQKISHWRKHDENNWKRCSSST